MPFETLCSIDLDSLGKRDLKALCIKIRDVWGKPIDLRSNCEALRQYIEDYRNSITPPLLQQLAEAPAELEVTIPKIAEIEVVTETPDHPTDNNSEAPDTLTNEDIPTPDQLKNNVFLTSYTHNFMDIPTSPASFNQIVESTINILLTHGEAYGATINFDWIAGILKDCSWRATIPNQLTEKLILEPHIFYGLAGIPTTKIDLFNRAITSPKEFNAPEDVNKGFDFYRNVGNMLGANPMQEVFTYHVIRKNLNWLQCELNISALEGRHYAIRDKLFSTIDYHDQMALLPSDRDVLKDEVKKIFDYFQLVSEGYDFYRELGHENLEPITGVTLNLDADYCYIYPESHNWEPDGDGSYLSRGLSVPRLEPDTITLTFQKWDGKEYRRIETFVAEHSDKSRFPWLTQA